MIIGQYEVEFTKDGSAFDPSQVAKLLDGLSGASDLLLLAHGWNNDLADAKRLYDRLIASFNQLPDRSSGPGSKLVVMRAYWPSKKFTDEELIPGGGAASAETENDAALRQALESLKRDPDRLGDRQQIDPIREANINKAAALIDRLDDPAAQHEFVLRIRAVLNPDEAHEEDGSREFFILEPEELFERFAAEVPVELQAGVGGATSVSGGAAGFFGDMLSGVKAGARRIANFGTYYQMKSRAGTVGKSGVAATLARVRERYPSLPIHLVGHSFGGRLVTAVAAALEPGPAPVTMTLLQAAFSHNGLAVRFDGKKDGAFRTIIHDKRISGPIAITHTKNDTAVGVAYPLASRIAVDNAAAMGDADDPYGGMGRNGAQHTPEVTAAESLLRPLPGAYTFRPGSVYNLNADDFIKEHNDVAGVQVANMLMAVIGSRP